MNVLKERNLSHSPSFLSILTIEVSQTISGQMEMRPRQSTRGPRTMNRGRKYILWMYMMAWYVRFSSHCFMGDSIRRKATINQAWCLHYFGFWRLQDTTRHKDDWTLAGFHLNCTSDGWVVVWGWKDDWKYNNQLGKHQKHFWCFVKIGLDSEIMSLWLVGVHMMLLLYPYGCIGPSETCGGQWGWVELKWRPFSCKHFMNKHSAHHFFSNKTAVIPRSHTHQSTL